MKTSDWVVVIGAIIGTGGMSGLFGGLVIPLLRRPAVRAEATERLTAAAAHVVDQLQEEVTAARVVAREASAEASAARLTVRTLGADVDELTRKLTRLIGWIHEPSMDITQLRILVPMPPAENGAARR